MAAMEELLAALIKKAESSGGEAWLRRCLEDVPRAEEPGPSRVICRILPPRQDEQGGDATGGAEVGEGALRGERPAKRRRRGKRATNAPPPSAPPEARPRSRDRGDRGASATSRHSEGGSRDGRSATRGSGRSDRQRSSGHSSSHSRRSGRHSSGHSRRHSRGHARSPAAVEPSLPTASNPAPQQPGPSSSAVGVRQYSVWIVGHSFVYWAETRAAARSYSASLAFDTTVFNIYWFGYRGLKWRELYTKVLRLATSFPPPDILLVHLGGNDVSRVRTEVLIEEMKRDLSMIKSLFPQVCLGFSEIIPRFEWKVKQLMYCERIRKRINHNIEKFMPAVGGFSFRHLELEGFLPGLYWSDLVHLSEIGMDIFNADLQSMIEVAAAVLLRGGGL
ncbi:uncharacterized protein [Dendropsophus ebraccatus]|uniref:uncharacterized protein n=1 Tax=Dendropsophus ebraccatus TaxID=150705 RepID=UPI003831B9E7